MLPTLASALSFRTWLYFHHLLLIYPSARTVAKAEGLSAHSTHHDRSFTHKVTSRAKRGREDLLIYYFAKVGSSADPSEARSLAEDFSAASHSLLPGFLPPLLLAAQNTKNCTTLLPPPYHRFPCFPLDSSWMQSRDLIIEYFLFPCI